jgi:hypothetical protein
VPGKDVGSAVPPEELDQGLRLDENPVELKPVPPLLGDASVGRALPGFVPVSGMPGYP